MDAGDEGCGGGLQIFAGGIALDDGTLVGAHLPCGSEGVGLGGFGVALRQSGDLRFILGQRALVARGARRMAETAALLADEVLPEHPLRQWVLSLPHALRFQLATDPAALTLVLGEAYRAISRHLLSEAGLTRAGGATGAVTLVQRFGSALNLNVHFHMLFLDGVYVADGTGSPVFRQVAGPGLSELQALVEQIAFRIEPCALRAQDPVPRRHDAHRARAAGSDAH